MNRDLSAALHDWLQAGLEQIGQIAIRKDGAGFALTHCEDIDRQDLELHTDPLAARLLSTYDDQNEFRPLKTAPNLRHGWRLILSDLPGLRLALDAFYPAMLGSWLSAQRTELRPVHLRETLDRQSGMYAVTKKLTDTQGLHLVAESCNSEHGCLKTILWQISDAQSLRPTFPESKLDPHADPRVTSGRLLPLLCGEACNLLVAKAREVVKKAVAAG